MGPSVGWCRDADANELQGVLYDVAREERVERHNAEGLAGKPGVTAWRPPTGSTRAGIGARRRHHDAAAFSHYAPSAKDGPRGRGSPSSSEDWSCYPAKS